MSNQFPVFTADQKTQILNAIATIKSALPELPVLEPDELKRMPKVDNNRIPFVNQTIELAQTNPALVPTFGNIEEGISYLKIRTDMDTIASALAEVTRAVDDIRAQSGSKAYMLALDIYNVAKRGAKKGITAMIVVAEQLKVFFESKAHTPKKKTEDKKTKD